MKTKPILIIIAVMAVVSCLACGAPKEKAPVKENIGEALITAGIEEADVSIYGDKVLISYQPSFASEEELLKEWVYIMGTAVEQAPWIDQVVIKCIFRGEEVMEVTSKTDNIVGYLTGKISPETFLPKLVVRPIGEGPLITPPE
jgi:hypothetical protein